ncbi:hypothetical protein P5V15_001141 [Pogonomyrmex californicus]
MDTSLDGKKREIAKTQDSIRKKHRALKIGETEEEIALEKRFKPIVQPLKRIAENTARDESTEGINPIAFVGAKRKHETDDEPPLRQTKRRLSTRSPSIATASPATRRIGGIDLECAMGMLGRKYMGALLSGDRQNEIDHVYRMYFDMGGSMLGDKRFDLAADDSVIVGDVRYPGTPGLYELIFKRLSDDVVYTENDKQMYKSILLTTNAYQRGHNALCPF